MRYDVTGRGERDVVLIHGHHAHHMWWHGIVPYLEENWRVTQLDLSGHGDSGHRDDYDSGRVWTDDVRAVVKAAGCERPELLRRRWRDKGVRTATGRPLRNGWLLAPETAIMSVVDRLTNWPHGAVGWLCDHGADAGDIGLWRSRLADGGAR